MTNEFLKEAVDLFSATVVDSTPELVLGMSEGQAKYVAELVMNRIQDIKMALDTEELTDRERLDGKVQIGFAYILLKGLTDVITTEESPEQITEGA